MRRSRGRILLVNLRRSLFLVRLLLMRALLRAWLGRIVGSLIGLRRSGRCLLHTSVLRLLLLPLW